jgi:hypothetical protein
LSLFKSLCRAQPNTISTAGNYSHFSTKIH